MVDLIGGGVLDFVSTTIWQISETRKITKSTADFRNQKNYKKKLQNVLSPKWYLGKSLAISPYVHKLKTFQTNK